MSLEQPRFPKQKDTIWDGKHIRRNHQGDVPYEQYVRNYDKKTSSLQDDLVEDRSVIRDKKANLFADKIEEAINIQSQIAEDRETSLHLGHYKKEFIALKEEEQRKFARMKSYENRKGHPEYDVVKQQWEEARQRVMDFEHQHSQETANESNDSIRVLNAEEQSEKYRSVGALQIQDIEQDDPAVSARQELHKNIESRTKKALMEDAESNARQLFQEYQKRLREKLPDDEIKSAKRDWEQAKEKVMELDGSLPEKKKDVYFDNSDEDLFEKDRETYRLAPFKDEHDRRTRDYESIQKKNTAFITESMLLRAKRKMENAERDYQAAQKDKNVFYQEKPEIGEVQEQPSRGGISSESNTKDGIKNPEKADKKKDRKMAGGWFSRNWRRASLFGAGILAALSIGKETSNSSASTISESDQKFEKVAPSKELKKITTYRELKKEGDGYTQVIKRIIEKNPELMEVMCIDDTSPDTMKYIGQEFGIIDKKGNEIRMTGDSVGGAVELVVGDNGVVTVRSVPSDVQAKEGMPNVLRVNQSTFEVAEGEYASTKDGVTIDTGDIADPFNVMKKK